MPAASNVATPPPSTLGLGSRQPITTRATPEATKAPAQGGVDFFFTTVVAVAAVVLAAAPAPSGVAATVTVVATAASTVVALELSGAGLPLPLLPPLLHVLPSTGLPCAWLQGSRVT